MLATFSGRRASQNEIELTALVDFMIGHGVLRYLEIGARHGDTFHHVMTALGKKARGVALDLPGGNWGKADSVKSLSRMTKQLGAQGFTVEMLLGDSSAKHVIQNVRHFAPFDLVLIDGDHRYEAVKADFETYGPMARFVAFHDIAGVGQTTHTAERLPVEVPRFWNDIKGSFTHHEFIGDGSTMGIGVLEMPSLRDAA